MTTQQFTPEEINRLGPGGVQAAIKAGGAVTRPDVKKTSFSEVVRRTDPYGGGFDQAPESQVIYEAGVVQLFHLQTGLSSFAPMNLLPSKLREIDEIGRMVWTTIQSEAPIPIKPEYTCMLHENHAMRPVADRMGFRVCNKMLFTQQDVIDHTKKHTRAWAAFERDTIENEKAEERDYRRTSMAAITQAALLSAPTQTKVVEKVCTECAESVFATDDESARIKLIVHMKQHGILIGEVTILQDSDLQEVIDKETVVETGPVPSEEQERLLALVVNFPTWCKVDGCDWVGDAKSKGGAGSSLMFHDRREHKDG